MYVKGLSEAIIFLKLNWVSVISHQLAIAVSKKKKNGHFMASTAVVSISDIYMLELAA